MPGIISSRTRRPYQRPPAGPFVLNRDSPQARGLVAWWPLGETNPAGYQDYAGGRWGLTQAGAMTVESPGSWAGGFGTGNTASTANYLTNAAAVLTDVPLTFNAWLYLRDATDYGREMSLVGIGDDALNTYYMLSYDGANGEGQGAHVAFFDRSSTVSSTWASTTTVGGAGTASMLTAVARTASDASIYLNAGGKNTDTASTRTPSNWVRTSVASLRSNASTFGPLSGVQWHTGVWNVPKTDSEVWDLYDPRTRWDLYYQLGRKTYGFPAAAPSGAPAINLRFSNP